MHDKQSLRKRIKVSLSELTIPLYEDYSYKIANQLFEDDDWKVAKIIGITISKRPEVDTYQIIRKAWELGKQVVVPKCYPEEKKLVFRTLKEFSQLESVFYGLLEPIEERTDKVEANEIDLLIVPGLAYTREGYRVGFGGGYYDRFLTNYYGKTLSLAFNNQIVEQFDMERHDLPVSKIITNHEVIHII
ncbi:5-formyltetrahydrofolate cyclo-ligase [Bacillus sp. SORGH_AS 510]|uniref:5-formyltetrahydrofolate cyclo-ligase n=1 Tax=Bacillus sp. SORGH_AS_0510 TaxID=3041771 RepID=UPI002784765C|nr:5-formyltetrahydrofolate cyclo-ligase [Bacillus sp. SORGH_AS_0510]MDQ1145046.1 5-formyltetrahydrofolate cyclo-ligase [Bacillus sp. SORGH_AS_0510]